MGGRTKNGKGATSPARHHQGGLLFGHVSASRCGHQALVVVPCTGVGLARLPRSLLQPQTVPPATSPAARRSTFQRTQRSTAAARTATPARGTPRLGRARAHRDNAGVRQECRAVRRPLRGTCGVTHSLKCQPREAACAAATRTAAACMTHPPGLRPDRAPIARGAAPAAVLPRCRRARQHNWFRYRRRGAAPLPSRRSAHSSSTTRLPVSWSYSATSARPAARDRCDTAPKTSSPTPTFSCIVDSLSK